MRLSAYVEPNCPDRDAILAAIKEAKAKGLDEFPVLLPSCGRLVLLRRAWSPTADAEYLEAVRWLDSEGGA